MIPKDRRPIRGAAYIASLVAEGEHEQQDFKYAVSDARKIARSIAAFANHLGGRLLIGVKDNGTVAGVRSDEDIYVIDAAAQSFCVPPQHVEYTPFRMMDGAVVYRAEIAKAERRPVCVRETDGLRAYLRRADENLAVPPLLVRAWREAGSARGIGTAEQAVMRCIAPEGSSPAELGRLSGLSLRTVEDALVTLHALGVVEMVITGPETVTVCLRD